jgi:hypothetical protein
LFLFLFIFFFLSSTEEIVLRIPRSAFNVLSIVMPVYAKKGILSREMEYVGQALHVYDVQHISSDVLYRHIEKGKHLIKSSIESMMQAHQAISHPRPPIFIVAGETLEESLYKYKKIPTVNFETVDWLANSIKRVQRYYIEPYILSMEKKNLAYFSVFCFMAIILCKGYAQSYESYQAFVMGVCFMKVWETPWQIQKWMNRYKRLQEVGKSFLTACGYISTENSDSSRTAPAA